MVKLLIWTSIMQFLVMPLLIVVSIWTSNEKFFYIGIVLGVFALLTGAVAETVKEQKYNGDDNPTLF